MRYYWCVKLRSGNYAISDALGAGKPVMYATKAMAKRYANLTNGNKIVKIKLVEVDENEDEVEGLVNAEVETT